MNSDIEWVEKVRKRRKDLQTARDLLKSLPYKVMYQGETLTKRMATYKDPGRLNFKSYERAEYYTEDNIEMISFQLITDDACRYIYEEKLWDSNVENIRDFLSEVKILEHNKPVINVEESWWKFW